MSIISFALVLYSANSCSFVATDSGVYLPGAISLELGLFSYNSDGNTCVTWSSEQLEALDRPWNVARTMVFMAIFFMALSVSLLVAISIWAMRHATIKMTVITLLLAAITQGTTFLAYWSTLCDLYGCNFHRASCTAVAAVVAITATAVLTARIPGAKQDDATIVTAGEDESMTISSMSQAEEQDFVLTARTSESSEVSIL